jgi:glutamate racemase
LEKCQKTAQALTVEEQKTANLLQQLALKDEIINLQEQKIVALVELGKVRQQIADEEAAAQKRSKWRAGVEAFGAGGILGAIGMAIAIVFL